MAIAAAQPAGEIARGRGGFYRNAQDTPFVTDPDGALVKSGPRKGKPKQVPYGSPSGRGKLIEDTWALAKWGERRTVRGIGLDLALIADCHRAAQLDAECDEFKDLADRIIMRAKDAAQSALAADRGTHGHALTEDHDEDRDWIQRAEAGEVLGLDGAVQASLVEAWRAMLKRDGLEILAVEASCVDDTWRLAGTLDRIARTTKPLRFALVTGEVVTIPADTVLVLDVKSGRKRTRGDGSVQYWAGYSIQIASYAQSVPYDTETETRSEWPWPISQEHALIAHLDVLGAIDGKPSCELVYVDLSAGREHGGATVSAAKAWGARRDVFSVAQLPGGDDESATTTAAPATPPAVEQQTTETDSLPASVVTIEHTWPDMPDEGGPADPAAVEALKKHYMALPEPVRKGVLSAYAMQALSGMNGRGRVPYMLTGDTGRHTVRRFEITRGLVTLAAADMAEDETIRCICASIYGDLAHWQALHVGQVIGALDGAEAALFAQRCDELVTATVPATVDEATGHVRLQFSDLAAPAA